MDLWQFLVLLASILVGGPIMHWLIANKNENAVWSGTLSLILDDDSFLPLNKHGTFILPSSECGIKGLVLHGVPVGKIPFIDVSLHSLELAELALVRNQSIYDVVDTGDIKFRFTRLIRPQIELNIRFTTDRKLQNTPNIFKQIHKYGGEAFFESLVRIKWPEQLVTHRS